MKGRLVFFRWSPWSLFGSRATPTPCRKLVASLAVVLAAASAWCGKSIQGQTAREEPIADVEVHSLPGSDTPTRPAGAEVADGGRLKLTIRDAGTLLPTPCRIHIVGSDGASYEPDDHPLSAWSLKRLGNRKDKGPFRYYGWFFYSMGTVDLRLPAGRTRIDVWKGFEFEPQSIEATIVRGMTLEKTMELTRRVDMASRGWFSGDTHIHLDRVAPKDDERALDLAAAEDIQFAHILCMNDPRAYSPTMDRQIHPQGQGMGSASTKTRGRYRIASGQEYRCATYGHICLLGGRRLVDADGIATDPNQWPLFVAVADELHGLGGYAFHAHGGYEQEIYADFAQHATDGVELLQFAVYRGIGREGWYHILNAGFRFPALGASDYPYCRALGDCRTYVKAPIVSDDNSAMPSFDAWNKAAAEGRSFFTTGPLLELTVSGKSPGETIRTASEATTLPVRISVASPVAAVTELELIVNGRTHQRKSIPHAEGRDRIEWETALNLAGPAWIAARAWAPSGNGRENVEAHTNPLWVTHNGTRHVDSKSVQWLIERLDRQNAIQQARTFPRKESVLAYYRKSRAILEERGRSALQEPGERSGR